MILLSKVDDRKTVLGLYKIAHEVVNGQWWAQNDFILLLNKLEHKIKTGKPNFPRPGQMITEYNSPMKKLCEDFVPHSKVLASIHLVVIFNLIFNFFFFSKFEAHLWSFTAFG